MSDHKINMSGLYGKCRITDQHGARGVTVPIKDPMKIQAVSLGDIKRKLLQGLA